MVIQRNALKRVSSENRLLQQQIADLLARADQVAVENRGSSTLIAPPQANAGALLIQEPSKELLRLRGEVGRLRLQERDAEQLRREQMQAAQAKLPNAEIELARMRTLHAEKLVSDGQFSQARFTVELLKAEAKGDLAEATRVRLRQAEEELARATELHSHALIGQAEYEQAVRKVESLRAGGR